MKTKDWIAFITLGLIWGSAFLWIKIAVQEVSPFMLVAVRLTLGTLALGAYVWWKKPPLPGERSTWLTLGLLGVTNIALPFVLVSWGEIHVDSAVAAILHSTVPLFTMVIAHFVLTDDRMSVAKVSGLLAGFVGVIVILLRDLLSGVHGSVLGQGAILLAGLSYAGSSVLIRARLRNVASLVQAFFPLLAADVLMILLTPIVDRQLVFSSSPLTWIALLWLGVISSAFAYILFYYLLHSIGPTRTTMMTYIFPIVGVALGAVFLDEQITWNLLAGGFLVILGILVVNYRSLLNGRIKSK